MWPWAVLLLAVAAVIYGATVHWWVGAVAAVVVLTVAAALFLSAVPAGQRGRFWRSLRGRASAADQAEATRLLDEHIARQRR